MFDKVVELLLPDELALIRRCFSGWSGLTAHEIDRTVAHLTNSQMLSAFTKWYRFALHTVRRWTKDDRRAIEAAIAVAELSLVWDCALGEYPGPDSSADCDDCGRLGCFRYYHLDDTRGGIDLCEACHMGITGTVAAEVAPELRGAFRLAAPQISAHEAWRDIMDRERALTRARLESRMAATGSSRAESQLALQIFVRAASAIQIGIAREARVDVQVHLPGVGGGQSVTVPKASAAAAMQPIELGTAVVRVLRELKCAASMEMLEGAMRDQLLQSPALPEAGRLEKPMAHALNVRRASRPNPPPSSFRTPLRAFSDRQQAPQALSRGTIFAPARGVDAAIAQEHAHKNQSDLEAAFLLKQLAAATLRVAPGATRVTSQAQLSNSSFALSVPKGCAAESMNAVALGEALVAATRKASSLRAVEATLEDLLRPGPTPPAPMARPFTPPAPTRPAPTPSPRPAPTPSHDLNHVAGVHPYE